MELMVNQRGSRHDEKGNEHPEHDSPENYSHHSLTLTVFVRRPFFVLVQVHLGVTEEVYRVAKQ